MDAISSALSSRRDVNDWAVRRLVRESTQLFLIGTEPEAVRQVNTGEYQVTVYRDHAGGRGQTTFTLTPSDLDALDAHLERAAFMAGLNGNPHYSQPRPGPLPQVELLDQTVASRPGAQEAITRLREQVKAAMAAEQQVRLSSLEAFVETGHVHLRTSTGVEGEYSGSHVTLDLVILSRGDDGKESEAQDMWDRRRMSDFDVPSLVRGQAQYARDSLGATLPPSGRYPVAISAHAAQPLFEPLLFKASGEAKFSRQSEWEVGQVVLAAEEMTGPHEQVDSVSIVADATFPYGTESQPFDNEGLQGRSTAFIMDGTLRSFLASERYAEYLNIPPTGPVGTVVLNTGTQTEAALLNPGEQPLLHIVSFSALVPDAITGDFSAEIRLGYLLTKDGARPVKGGTISGNVFSAFGQVQLSREADFLGSYHGPRLLRFLNLSITGS